MFQVCNIGTFVIGAGTMSAGIYISVEEKEIDWYNISFICLGFITFLLGLLGCKSRSSTIGLSAYIIGILLCTIAQTGFTIGIIFYSDFSNTIGSVSAIILRSTLGGACGLLLICFLLSWRYRNSLKIASVYHEGYEELRKPPTRTETGTERKSKYEEIRARRNNN
ncbi:hypothetical protein SteCoe_30800 [Stentor coeruleus]|uniref:Uncharacterized protein n=1 Tax=Stentor coeruleus TaxID=5963 RepID=A0A1R2B2Q3_9CILI|nr:hypothetical protein SteCoe_30800 [Stentor coeruleus]